jgi:hypothetical protein
MLYLALLGSAVAYLCQFYVLENVSPVQALYPTLINPIVGIILGVVFLDEQLSVAALAGTVLVLLGVWLVNRPAAAGIAPGGAGAGVGQGAGPGVRLGEGQGAGQGAGRGAEPGAGQNAAR